MELEPGRCRRTDGKKWRCRLDVVPDQKYCERHMHRGRMRSRKPVEATENTSQFGKRKPTCANKTIESHDPTDSDSEFFTPGNNQFKVPSSKKSNAFPVASTITSSAYGKSNSNVSVTSKRGVINNNINTSCGAGTENAISRNNSKYADGKDAGFTRSNDKEKKNSSKRNGNSQSGSETPAFVFTLKSGRSDGSRKSSYDHISADEAEPQRCKRTDGRKWQCSKDVTPQEKYCDDHIHRGAKRLMVSTNATTVGAAYAPCVTIPKNDHINLNISIDSPQSTDEDANCSTSSTSDTDGSVDVSHLLDLSP